MKLTSFVCTLGFLLVSGGLANAQIVSRAGKGADAAFKAGQTVNESAVKGYAVLERVNPVNRGFTSPMKNISLKGVHSPYLVIEKAPASNAQIMKGSTPEGLSFQKVGDTRKIILSDFPTLANNRKPEDMALVFGVEQGMNLLLQVLRPYQEQYPLHGTVMDGIVSYAYETVVEDPAMWDIKAQVIGITKITGPTLDGFPKDLTVEVAAKESPALFQNLNVLTLREYVIKHGYLFPSYVNDEELLPVIHGVWRRLIAGELPPEATNMLVQSYFYSLNARDIETIVTEAETFVRENGRFPGLKWLTLSPYDTYAYLEAGGAEQLSPEKIDEITLGMQASLVTKGVPHCTWLWDTLPSALKIRINRLNFLTVAH